MIEFVFAGVAVSDYHRALAWYELVFGRAPDVIVREDIEAMWQLRESAWMYIVVDGERAGKSLAAFLVSDLEQELAALSNRGVDVPEMEIAPGLYRKVVLTDPDGNSLTIGQSLSGGGDR